MTSLHYNMLKELQKRSDLFLKEGNKKVFLYNSTGSPTIDSLLVDIVNGINFNLIKAKIVSEIKIKKYAEALVYTFQKLNDNEPFNAEEVFNKFNKN